MFAVLKTGGKQYRVQPGDVLRVEKLAAEAGETIQFNDVLMIGGDAPQVGVPFVSDAAVQATVIDQIKGEKLIHFVKRRRKHSSKRTRGHRQQLTLLRITEILAEGAGKSGVKAALGGRSAPAEAKPVAAEAKPAAASKSASSPDAAPGLPANLLGAPRDGGADDLRKLAGVGPKLEGVLHENGVFHFDQIAAWSADEASIMGERLGAKSRMDNWVEQAKTLAAEKE